MAPPRDATRDTWVQPTLLGIFAALIVLYRLGTNGLWADEAFSVSTSDRSWTELARLSYNAETNGILYAFFLKAWATFGTSELWLRLPSAGAFVVAVVFTWALGRRLHGQVVGAISAALLAAHGSLLQYGQNIRLYAPLVAVGLGFLILVHRMMVAPSRRRLFWLGAIAMMLPLLHLVATTLIIGAAAIFVFDEVVRRRGLWSLDKAPVRTPIGGRLFALLPALVIALGVAGLVSSHDEGQSINLPFGRDAVAEVVFVLTGSGGRFGVVGYGLLLLAGSVMIRSSVCQHMKQGGRTVDVLVPWILVVSTLLCVLVGSLVTPLMVGRYLLFLSPYIAIAAAIGIVSIARAIDTSADHASRRLGGMTLPAASPQPWGAQRLVTAAVLCLTVLVGGSGAASGAVRWMTESDRVDWRPISKSMLQRSRPTDGVLFANDSTRLFVEYQLKQDVRFVASAPTPVFPPQPWGQFQTGDQHYQAFSLAQVESALEAHPRVWLVVEGPLVDEPFPDLPKVLSSHRPVDSKMFGGTGTLYLLESGILEPVLPEADVRK